MAKNWAIEEVFRISYYEILCFFLIYSFFGWCLEVVYQAIEHGKFINRGFLNGPYCPIYGFGVIIVTGALDPIKSNAVLLFFGSVILTSILEFITGFVLEKIFHMHWWDYSEEKFNLSGYICLKFSLLWGVACLVVVRIIHPTVTVFVDKFPSTAGIIIISVYMIGVASDMIVTVLAIIHFKRRIILLENISSQMRKLSDKTGEMIFDKVEGAMNRKEEFSVKNAELRKKYEDLKERYKAVLEKRERSIRRIQRSFPKLSFDSLRSFREQLDELKDKINKK
ncbi:MAG TPA: hypothetical protein P5191_11595 [Ruminococcus sp.]|nr:hypothetical protein [Ruminococcus sp.]